MKKYIIVKADTNDGDYVTQKSLITDEQLEQIKPIIEAIKNFQAYTVENVGYNKSSTWKHNNNYPQGDCCRDNLGEKSAEELYGHIESFEKFDENFVPYGEYGIHTIESIEILEVFNEEKLI